MTAEKGTPEGPGGQPGQTVDDSNVAEFYANFVACNITPLDMNLIFGRAGIPVASPHDLEVPWNSNLKYVARVSLPLAVLPLITKLLEGQLDRAKSKGMISVEEIKAEPVKS